MSHFNTFTILYFGTLIAPRHRQLLLILLRLRILSILPIWNKGT